MLARVFGLFAIFFMQLWGVPLSNMVNCGFDFMLLHKTFLNSADSVEQILAIYS
jgi:hypothetical protein